jgi:hypothetical protein
MAFGEVAEHLRQGGGRKAWGEGAKRGVNIRQAEARRGQGRGRPLTNRSLVWPTPTGPNRSDPDARRYRHPGLEHGPWIGAAIRSGLPQTRIDWRMMVVDDGSTDGTPDVVRALFDERLTLLRQDHEGVSAARNRGLLGPEPSCKAILFLDADDQLTPNALTRLVAGLRAAPHAVAAAGQCAIAGRLLPTYRRSARAVPAPQPLCQWRAPADPPRRHGRGRPVLSPPRLRRGLGRHDPACHDRPLRQRAGARRRCMSRRVPKARITAWPPTPPFSPLGWT